jgi:NDP-sugar pyrophosphorylase family protein
MMPVAILCGGKATRLGDLTKDTPKYLVDVNGKPFAWWQIQLLKSHGYTDIVLLTGHLHEQIESVVGDGSPWGVNVRYHRDTMHDIGTHGAILSALPLLGHTFFVLYGDSYLDCDYANLERLFREDTRQDALFTIYHDKDYGLRAFRRYPARHAKLHYMHHPFMEIGSHAGLAQLRTHLSERNQPVGARD